MISLSWPIEFDEFQLVKGEVHLWFVSLNPHAAHLNSFREVLSEDERERAAKFRFWRDQRRYLVGRGMLRQLIGSYLMVKPQSISFQYNDFGKPYLEGKDLNFNLAHCQDLILYGFCLSSDIGVDLECIRQIEDIQGLASRFFSKNESQVIKNAPKKQKNKLFLLYWTLKEAYIKAIGEGLSYPLNKFEVAIPETDKPTIIPAQENGKQTSWSGYSLYPDSSCVAAVTVRGEKWRLIKRKIEG